MLLGLYWRFRGWALHDRQTGLNETIPLAELESFGGPSPLFMQTRNVDLKDEIDGRWGFSYGLNVRYLSRLDVRFTRYDNNADPSVFSEGQWAWDTKFNHLAVKYNISRTTSFFSQFLTGDTEAGKSLSHRFGFRCFLSGPQL